MRCEACLDALASMHAPSRVRPVAGGRVGPAAAPESDLQSRSVGMAGQR